MILWGHLDGLALLSIYADVQNLSGPVAYKNLIHLLFIIYNVHDQNQAKQIH